MVVCYQCPQTCCNKLNHNADFFEIDGRLQFSHQKQTSYESSIFLFAKVWQIPLMSCMIGCTVILKAST